MIAQDSTANISLLSIATAVPDNVVETDAMLSVLSSKLTSELKDIISHLGVKQRYSVVEDYPNYLNKTASRKLISSTSKLAAQAIQRCIEKHPNPTNIGLLIAITNTADRPLPCLSYELINEFSELLPRGINTINMQNQGCSVLLKAVDIARCYLALNPEQQVLIVAAESHTAFAESMRNDMCYGYHELHKSNPTDKNAFLDTQMLVEAFLFGDGAVALLFGKEDAAFNFGSIIHLTNVRKDDTELLSINEGGALHPEYEGFPHYMMSREVPMRGAQYAKETIIQLMQKTDSPFKCCSEADFCFIHTGSKLILDRICAKLNIHSNVANESYKIIENYGNLSSCSVGFMLADFFEHQMMGTKVGLITSFGVGFSASAGFIHVNV
jgi:3-oxoacyl-[acyl-carrier-protein] synthase III